MRVPVRRGERWTDVSHRGAGGSDFEVDAAGGVRYDSFDGHWWLPAGCRRQNRESGESPEQPRYCDRERTPHDEPLPRLGRGEKVRPVGVGETAGGPGSQETGQGDQPQQAGDFAGKSGGHFRLETLPWITRRRACGCSSHGDRPGIPRNRESQIADDALNDCEMGSHRHATGCRRMTIRKP